MTLEILSYHPTLLPPYSLLSTTSFSVNCNCVLVNLSNSISCHFGCARCPSYSNGCKQIWHQLTSCQWKMCRLDRFSPFNISCKNSCERFNPQKIFWWSIRYTLLEKARCREVKLLMMMSPLLRLSWHHGHNKYLNPEPPEWQMSDYSLCNNFWGTKVKESFLSSKSQYEIKGNKKPNCSLSLPHGNDSWFHWSEMAPSQTCGTSQTNLWFRKALI